MPLREWFRPPRHLLLVLLLLTVASVSALLWSGWKLTEQESAVEVLYALEPAKELAGARQWLSENYKDLIVEKGLGA